jgi:hypothetical protein
MIGVDIGIKILSTGINTGIKFYLLLGNSWREIFTPPIPWYGGMISFLFFYGMTPTIRLWVLTRANNNSSRSPHASRTSYPLTTARSWTEEQQRAQGTATSDRFVGTGRP